MFEKRSCDHFRGVRSCSATDRDACPLSLGNQPRNSRVNDNMAIPVMGVNVCNLLNSNGIEIRATCSHETDVRNT